MARCFLFHFLWKHDDGKMIARLMFASMPSGQPKIIDLRPSMRGLMIGQGWSNNPWVIPIVEHRKNILDPDNFGSRVIYVGQGRGWLQSSPWVNPCDNEPIPDPHGGTLNFAKYCSYRADINEFLETSVWLSSDL